MGKERFDNMIKGMENPTTGMILGRNVGMGGGLLVIGFLIASLIILIIGRMSSTEGNFVMVFAALLHANFIDKILGSAVKLALILTRKSVTETSTSLALAHPTRNSRPPRSSSLASSTFSSSGCLSFSASAWPRYSNPRSKGWSSPSPSGFSKALSSSPSASWAPV